MNTKGVMLATAAAAFFASGAGLAQQTPAAGNEAKVRCDNVNSCCHLSECKTATNTCKGKNSCAGQGMRWLTRAECLERGGEPLGPLDPQEPVPAFMPPRPCPPKYP